MHSRHKEGEIAQGTQLEEIVGENPKHSDGLNDHDRSARTRKILLKLDFRYFPPF